MDVETNSEHLSLEKAIGSFHAKPRFSLRNIIFLKAKISKMLKGFNCTDFGLIGLSQ
jgi:hypothetical protein